MRYFDAHNHLQNYASAAGLAGALAAASAAGGMLCCATRPGDWRRVLEISAGDKRIIPCLGVHPWFSAEAALGWLEALEAALLGAPSCVGEIGLDGARPAPGQEEIFRAQLGLAKKLGRPSVIHCVKSWGRLAAVLKEARPGAFMLHSYGGPPELVKDLAALGGYFSFSGELTGTGRKKMRAALAAVPRGRLLFETDSPAPGAESWRAGPAGIVGVVAAAAAVLGVPAGELAELSYNNGRAFAGRQGRSL